MRCFSACFEIHLSGVVAALFSLTWLVPLKTAAISARSVYCIQPCITSRHFMQRHIGLRREHTCLAVISYLHFWQNDQDFLRATAVTRGWSAYRGKSQHKKLIPPEKKILPPLLSGLEPRPFDLESGALPASHSSLGDQNNAVDGTLNSRN